MKLIFTIFFVFSGFQLFAQQDVDCLSAHRGRYILRDSSQNIVLEFIRNDTHHIERYPEFNAECIYSINWLSPCRFKIKLETGNEGCFELLPPNLPPMVYEIIEVRDSTVVMHGGYSGDYLKFRMDMVRIPFDQERNGQ